MTARSQQLVLPFTPRTCHGGADFLVADCNREAVAWLDLWPDWHEPGLIVHGPAASGKSHLVQLFLDHTGGTRVTADSVVTDIAELTFDFPAVAVDDADELIRSGIEQPLLHLFNGVKEAGGRLLLTGTASPGRWPFRLADLASRLRALPAACIHSPDEALLTALIVKLFHDRQVIIEDAVPSYMLARIPRTFNAVRSAVERIDAVSFAERRRVGVALVREALAERPGGQPTLDPVPTPPT